MSSLLDAIGNTPLVRLERLPKQGSAEVYVKLESQNPTGSMKDRGGITSGANIWAALRLADKLGPRRRVVTVIVDSCLKYLSGDLF